MLKKYNVRQGVRDGLGRVFRRALSSPSTEADLAKLVKRLRKWAPVIEQVAQEAKRDARNDAERGRYHRRPRPLGERPRPWVERAWCNACGRTRVVGHEDHWVK